MILRKVCIIFCLFAVVNCFSQGWIKSYNFSPGNSGNGRAIKRGKENAYYALQTSLITTNSNFSQQFLLKLDTNGNLIWKRKLSGSQYAGSGSLNILSDSTIVLTDIFYNGSIQTSGFRRFSPNGVILDSVIAYPRPCRMATYVFNDTLVSMGVNTGPGGSDTAVTERRDKNLNLIWQQYSLATSIKNYDFATCIDSVGNAIFLTRQNSFVVDYYTILKYGTTGNLIYSKIIDEGGVPFPMSQTNQHQIFVDESYKVKILTALIGAYSGAPLSYISTYNEIADTTNVTKTFNTNIWQITRNADKYYLLNWIFSTGNTYNRIDVLHKTDRNFSDLSNFIIISDTIDYWNPEFDRNYLLFGGTSNASYTQYSQFIRLDTSGFYNVPNLNGIVVNDSNNNCIKDNPDSILIHNVVSADNGGQIFYTISDAAGRYSLALPNGNYFIRAQKPTVSYDNCAVMVGLPVSISVGNVTNKDIPFYLPSYFDVAVGCGTMGSPRPGFANVLCVGYNNYGTAAVGNCVVKVRIDTLLKNIASNPSPSASAGDTLIYNISSIAAHGFGLIKISFDLDTGAVIGDSILLQSWIVPPSGDSIVSNNSYLNYEKIIGGYDPNNKEVFPRGSTSLGYVSPTQNLEYVVRFQNTGNSYAQDIFVLDTIDSHLDLSTLNILYSSHPFQVSIINNNVLKILFKNIFLPDTVTSEPLSHGFFKYSISPKINLNPGDQIKNTAYIFFDYNRPVKTNTTLNTVNSSLSVDYLYKQNGDILIYPNPSSDKINIVSPGKIKIIKVFNLLGDLLYAKTINQNQGYLYKGEFQNGVYLVEIESVGGQIVRQKVIFAN